MQQTIGLCVLGTVGLLGSSVWSELAGQEARRAAGSSKPFQSIVGHAPTLRGLIERARPIPKRLHFVRHFEALELATRAYSERLRPGAYVFGSSDLRKQYDDLNNLRTKGALLTLSAQVKKAHFEMWAWQPVYHWQVLEFAQHRKAMKACSQTQRKLTAKDWDGFEAVTYINHLSKRVVVAIAGTDPQSKADLLNDWTALLGRMAPHFDVACAYFQHVIRNYEPRLPEYSYECSGHSLGGGACSVSANRLGQTGVTLNPIGTHRPVGGPVLPQPTKLSNYIDPKDFALDLYKSFNRHPDGRIYWISDRPVNPSLLRTLVSALRRQPKIVRMWDSYLAHSATRSLDRLASFQRLKRLR